MTILITLAVLVALKAAMCRATGLSVSWYGAPLVLVGTGLSAASSLVKRGTHQESRMASDAQEFAYGLAIFLFLVIPLLYWELPQMRFMLGLTWYVITMSLLYRKITSGRLNEIRVGYSRIRRT